MEGHIHNPLEKCTVLYNILERILKFLAGTSCFAYLASHFNYKSYFSCDLLNNKNIIWRKLRESNSN
jgi:hypothetical protein